MADIARTLHDLADRVAISAKMPPQSISLFEVARRIAKCRPVLGTQLGADLFSDPARDMLIDLYIAEAGRKRIAISSLCIASRVPPTTALRWIAALVEAGLCLRVPDPRDGRRIFLELTDRARAGLTVYLTAWSAAFN